MVHNKEKDQLKETDRELTQMIQLVDKNINTIL